MNNALLKKNISNIILSRSNSEINFFTTKKSFLDKNFSSLNDVFLEINRVGEQEYGIQSEKLNLQFSQIISPVKGVVSSVEVVNIEQVITAGTQIATIVPFDDKLQVVANVLPQDIA